MLKKNKEPKNGTMEAALQRLDQFMVDVNDRLDAMERNKDASGMARLYIAQRLFDPDEVHLPEMSNNPLRTIRPMADAHTAGSILNPKVQRGEISLSQVWRNSYYIHMRGLRGNLSEKAKELALEEVRTEGREEPYEQADLGKGL